MTRKIDTFGFYNFFFFFQNFGPSRLIRKMKTHTDEGPLGTISTFSFNSSILTLKKKIE